MEKRVIHITVEAANNDDGCLLVSEIIKVLEYHLDFLRECEADRGLYGPAERGLQKLPNGSSISWIRIYDREGSEALARNLHEAGRAAVENGNTVAAEKFGEVAKRFLEWDEISEVTREGRRIQARHLLGKYAMARKGDPRC